MPLSDHLRNFLTPSNARGFSVLELITVVALSSILMGIAVLNMREFANPVQTGAAVISAFLKEARAKAISTTSAYTIRPDGANTLVATYAATCAAEDQQSDDNLQLQLPSGASFAATDWFICYNSRGFPDANISIWVHDANYDSRSVEVLLGGAVRIHG